VPAATQCGYEGATKCCNADPNEIAHWIYTSQTACYAKQRAKAVSRLGRHYDCQCNPEIMTALIYALNDCDERVRRQAADKIGDQLKKNPCCCNSQVVAALTAALADCDKRVRREAEKALCICGYDVQDAPSTCAHAGLCGAGPACGVAGSLPIAAPEAPAGEEIAPPPAPEGGEAAPAPAPAPAPTATPASEKNEPEAYFPSRLKGQQTKKKNGLFNLFGLR